MIILAILFVLFFLLCMPIALQITADNQTIFIQLRCWLVRFTLFPRKQVSEKSVRKKQKKSRAKQKPQEKEKPAHSKVSLENVWDLLQSSQKSLSVLRRHLMVPLVRFHARISAQEAHETALLYGRIACWTTAALELLDSLFVLGKTDISLVPDFTAEESRYSLCLHISIRGIFLLAAALYLLIQFFRQFLSRKRTSPAHTSENNHVVSQ